MLVGSRVQTRHQTCAHKNFNNLNITHYIYKGAIKNHQRLEESLNIRERDKQKGRMRK